jgi:hypothetical protein
MSILDAKLPSQRAVDTLALAARGLKQAISAEAPGRERQWAQTVDDALSFAETAMRKHRSAAQGAKGTLAAVDVTRPTLARQADELRNEHGLLLSQVIGLRDKVRRAGQAFRPTLEVSTNDAQGIADLGAIRADIQQFVDRLEDHRDAEINLIQESVLTDIGVGD